MDPVPRMKFIDAGPMAPLGSAQPAIAQANAAARLGQAIAGIGDMGFQIAEKVRRTTEAGKMSAFMANLDEEANRFSLDLTKRPDPEAWVDDWAARQEDFKRQAADLGLSREAQAALDIELNDWNSQRGIRFETQAFVRMTAEGKARISNSIQYHASRGDADGVRRESSRMREAGFEESEIEQVEREADRIAAVADVQRQVAADPVGMLPKLRDPDFVANTPGITLADADRLEQQARTIHRTQTYDLIEQANNAMADGSISSPEQIDQRFAGKASPALLERMKADLQERRTAIETARRATPEYVNEVTGHVTAQLDSYNAEIDGFDEVFYSLDRAIRTLPEGIEKARLNDRLDRARKGQLEEWTDAADETRSKLKEAYKSGSFGEGLTRQPLNKIIADGILNDRQKLAALGFAPEQVEKIAALGYTEEDGKTVRTVKNLSEQIATFREEMKTRPGFDSSDPYDRAAFLAINSGKTGQIEYPDPAGITKANAAYGKAVSDFEKWHKVNPKATPEQRELKFRQLLSPEGLKKFQSAILPPADFIDVPEPNAAGRYGMDGNAGLPANAYGDGTGGQILPPPPEE
jgi:hypothetical protein